MAKATLRVCQHARPNNMAARRGGGGDGVGGLIMRLCLLAKYSRARCAERTEVALVGLTHLAEVIRAFVLEHDRRRVSQTHEHHPQHQPAGSVIAVKERRGRLEIDVEPRESFGDWLLTGSAKSVGRIDPVTDAASGSPRSV